MPNVPPYGIFGWPTAFVDALPATDVLHHNGTNWTDDEVTEVYSYIPLDDHTGEWRLIWSRSAGSPASATIAYSTTAPDGPRVEVSWVPSTPLIADSYNVYRPDGSLAGSVSAPATGLVDLNPRPLNGAYTVRGVLSGTQGPATATNTLDLTLAPATASTAVVSNGLANSSVDVSWTHNAVGRPDQYQVLRNDAVIGTVAGTVLTFNDPAPPRGTQPVYSVRAVLSTIAGGETDAAATNVGAAPPATATLTATTSPLSNLRLAWTAPANGVVTGYEVETSTNGSTWAAHSDDITPSDWSTTVSGWMRVRSTSLGGPSAWVVRGPVEPVNDITPPPNPAITSFKPESSYGRMVLRFTTPNVPDFNSYLIQHRFGTSGYSNLTGWVAANPNTPVAVVCLTIAAGQDYRVRILVRDDDFNQNTGSEAQYVAVASPTIIDPSGSLSGTFRNGAWRNDGTRSSTEIATGWTSSGHNIGCFFYGTTIDSAMGNRTYISGTIEYYRENEGGLSAAVQPLFWTHALTTRSGTPVPDAEGVAEASRLGQGVARSTPNDTGTFSLPSAFLTALQNGSARGLCMYRGYQGSGDPDSYYALLGIGDVTNNGVVNGRLRLNHLG